MTPVQRAKKNTRTKSRSFRISCTQFVLLSAPAFKDKASPLVRVLLHLYFNKNLEKFDIERMVNEEVGKTKAAEINGQKKLEEYNAGRKRGE